MTSASFLGDKFRVSNPGPERVTSGVSPLSTGPGRADVPAARPGPTFCRVVNSRRGGA